MNKPLELRAYAKWMPTTQLEADVFLSNARLHLLNRGISVETISIITGAREQIFEADQEVA